MNILLPLPRHGYDPTEVAVSWKILAEAGHAITFATPDAQVAQATR